MLNPLLHASLGAMLMLACANAFAAQFFVAPDGSDNNAGAIGAPLATVQKAHDKAAAGDTIILRGGTYYPTAKTRFTRNGNSTWSYVLAYEDDTEPPVFDGRSMPDNTNTWEFTSSSGYWHVRGVTITAATNNGIFVGGSHVTLEEGVTNYCGKTSGTVDNQSGRGILGYHCSNLTVRNWDSHHNADLASDGRNPYEDADGFAILGAGKGNRFEGCRAWHNSDDGWDFYYGEGNSVELVNCWAAYNGYDDDKGTIGGTPNAELGDGNGFKLGGQDPASGSPHKLHQCCAWKNKARGFDYNTNAGAIEIYNCTGWSNPWVNFHFSSQQSKAQLRNCLSFAGTVNMGDNVDSRFNSWDNATGVTVTSQDFESLNDADMFAKRNSDGSLPSATFLRLADGSDCVDAGTDVGLAFSGSHPDLGCFEREPPTIIIAPAAHAADLSGSAYRTALRGFSSPQCHQVILQHKTSGMQDRSFSINGRLWK